MNWLRRSKIGGDYMKEEIPIFSIRTTYKGIQFRSRLESNIAYFLDKLDIKWQYEPKSFLLSNGNHYMPDFYLPELKTWVEAKGIIEMAKKQWRDYMTFCTDLKTELALIGPDFSSWFSASKISWGEHTSTSSEEWIHVGKCSSCGSYFFCGSFGSYGCRKCGNHDLKFYLTDFDEGLETLQKMLISWGIT